MLRTSGWIRTIGAVALLGTVLSCSKDRSGPVAPPEPDPPPPAQVPSATLEITGPDESQSWVEVHHLGQLHGCAYPVELKVGGEPQSTAQWVNSSLIIDPGAGYTAETIDFEASQIADFFDAAVVSQGDELTATLGFFFIFYARSDAPWRQGKYKATWRLRYTTGGSSVPKTAEYVVDCLLPAKLPPLTGEYEMESRAGEALPVEISPGTIKHASTLTFYPDSTYTTTVLLESDGQTQETTSARTSYDPYTLQWLYLPTLGAPADDAGFATHSDTLIVHRPDPEAETEEHDWVWRRADAGEASSSVSRPLRTVSPRPDPGVRALMERVPAVSAWW